MQSLLKSLRITSHFRLQINTICLMIKSKNHDHFFKICHANFFDVTGTRAPKVLRALYYLENCHRHFFAITWSFPKSITGCSKNVTGKKNNKHVCKTENLASVHNKWFEKKNSHQFGPTIWYFTKYKNVMPKKAIKHT